MIYIFSFGLTNYLFIDYITYFFLGFVFSSICSCQFLLIKDFN